MFRELVALGEKLNRDGALPPPCFYRYGSPIKWIVHFGESRVYIQPTAFDTVRPSAGRSGQNYEPHLLTDEAAYALGVTAKDDKGAVDTSAAVKHRNFCALLGEFAVWTQTHGSPLHDDVHRLQSLLARDCARQEEHFGRIRAKDWVSFVPSSGPNEGKQLFLLADATLFWQETMEMHCRATSGSRMPQAVLGECSVCGETRPLVRKMPLQVKLAAQTPIHSINESAFTSFVDGAESDKRAHLGLCFRCAELASRAFNYLSDRSQHRKKIVRSAQSKDRDKLSNQYAIWWIGDSIQDDRALESRDGFDPNTCDLSLPMAKKPDAELSQLLFLLKQPWNPQPNALRLDEDRFYLALLSPNVGRVALRDWFSVSLSQLISHLARFLDASVMVDDWGRSMRPASIGVMRDALGTKNPNWTRALLRCAYRGDDPPPTLAAQAGRRLGYLLSNERGLRERQEKARKGAPPVWSWRWPRALASAIRIDLCYQGRSEILAELNEELKTGAYLCGRLLALLERAQQRHYKNQNGKWPEVTLVQRAYAGAASTPAATFDRLLERAAVAHLRKAGDINRDVEELCEMIAMQGGFPPSLTTVERSEFALGYFQQRSELRSRYKGEDPAEARLVGDDGSEEAADDEENVDTGEE